MEGLIRKKQLKELLLESGLVDPKKLEIFAAKSKGNVAQLLMFVLKKNVIERQKLLEIVLKGWNAKAVDLSQISIDPDVLKLVPEALQKRHTLLPFMKEEGILLVAMPDPRDLFVADDIQLRTGFQVKSYFAFPDDILAAARRATGGDEKGAKEERESSGSGLGRGPSAIELAAEEFEDEEEIEAEDTASQSEVASEALEKALEAVRDQDMGALGEGIEVAKGDEKADITEVDTAAPEVEKIINIIILAAMREKASDIHIEPFEDPKGKRSKVIVRLRVDGMLRDAKYIKIPWPFRNAIIAKIKIMTKSMNITERRIPQSGRIQVMAKGNPVEFRCEVVPTAYGESCVMRVLDRRSVQVDINSMGFLPDTLEKLLGLLKGIGGKKNFGLVLVCGPTGSGKSTTLYGCLNHINRPDIKILTAENPVEYNLDGIIQVPVNPDLKLSGDKVFDFSAALRSFLRLDPDVIMVGEIRDKETAHIAMEAAMTGHLVFSTLHTNDAPSTIARITEMKIPAYLVASTTKAILAQRLARRLCSECKVESDPKPDEIAVFKEHDVPIPKGTKFYRGKGCDACKGGGFKGRCGIHELLVMDDNIRTLCLKEVAADPLRKAAVASGMRTLIQDGLMKVIQGMTTVKEVLGGAEQKEEDEPKTDAKKKEEEKKEEEKK
ncbi:MAG: Flp pilus assembly complex ATPase component TadA [Elusimicrobia bacterium]|nr:Flp pilus assembly complex ATPase component TadA [Elusimicrobiota bacterium]